MIIAKLSQQRCRKSVLLQSDNFKLNRTTMKKALLPLLAVTFLLLLFSCSRGITMSEAANGKAKCGRYIK